MLLIALALVAAPAAPTASEEALFRRMLPFRAPVDDAYLAREFADNPARLDAWVRAHPRPVLVVGRVREIAPADAGTYLVTLSPRMEAFGVVCRVSNSRSVVPLHRGDLIIVSGVPAPVRDHGLPMGRCKIEYRFTGDAAVIGASYGLCLGEFSREMCQLRPDCDRATIAKMEPILKVAAAAAGAKPIGCFQHVLALLFACEGDEAATEPVRVSCTERHEVVDARNAIPADAEGRSQGESAPFTLVHRERSGLYEAMAGAGRIKDEEP